MPIPPIPPSPSIAPDALGRLPRSKSYLQDIQLRVIGSTTIIGSREASASAGPGETTIVPIRSVGPISQLRLLLPQHNAYGGTEINNSNPIFYYGAVEYPLTSGNPTPPQFTLAGKARMRVDGVGSGAESDPLGAVIPGGTYFNLRYGVFVAQPPASFTAVKASGGSLAASTTYYYKLSSVIDGVESAATSEVSVATDSTNLSVVITAVVPATDLGYDAIRVYRATTSGAELFLGTVLYPGLTFVDTGILPTVAGFAPQTTPHTYFLSDYFRTGIYSTATTAFGHNYVSGVGTVYAGLAAGPVQKSIATPVILGDDMMTSSILGLGDSIMAGYNISAYSEFIGFPVTKRGWFYQGLPDGTFNSLNVSLPSARVLNLTSSLTGTFLGSGQRLRMANHATHIVNNMVSNDLYNGTTWQQVASAHLTLAKAYFLRGKRYFITTCLPRTTSTDSFTTLGNQTLPSYETARENYNSWVRNGMLVDGGGNPVLSGGTPTPYIQAAWDAATALGEVNSAGVPTLNGGYWPGPATLYTGQVLTGTPTATSLTVGGASYTLYGLPTMAVKMTSGAASGLSAIINVNTPTVLTLATALGTVPAAGDTLSIFNSLTEDGTHPNLPAHNLMTTGANGSQGWAAFAAANFQTF